MSVFKDKKRLYPTYIPKKLPHREDKIDLLNSFYEDFLLNPKEVLPRPVQIIGPVGSGKTSVAYLFGSRLESRARKLRINLKSVFVNCKVEAPSRYSLYSSFLEKAAGISARGMGPEEMLKTFVKQLRKKERYALIILDEVEYLVRREKEMKEKGSTIYDLTRISEIQPGEYQNILGTIFISRSTDYHRLLDPSERSTLGYTIVRMDPYNAEELRDILDMRAEIAFKPGAVDESVIDLIADVTSTKSVNPGDARFALDILYYSGLIADRQGSDCVELEHARTALSQTLSGIRSEDLIGLEEDELLALLGVARALRAEKEPFTSLAEAYDFYKIVCEEKGLKPSSVKKFKESINELRFRDLLTFSERGITIIEAPLRDIEDKLELILRRLKLV